MSKDEKKTNRNKTKPTQTLDNFEAEQRKRLHIFWSFQIWSDWLCRMWRSRITRKRVKINWEGEWEEKEDLWLFVSSWVSVSLITAQDGREQDPSTENSYSKGSTWPEVELKTQDTSQAWDLSSQIYLGCDCWFSLFFLCICIFNKRNR